LNISHFSPIFSVWTPGIQESAAKSPGENGKKSRKLGKKKRLGHDGDARARCSQIVEKLESLRGAE